MTLHPTLTHETQRHNRRTDGCAFVLLIADGAYTSEPMISSRLSGSRSMTGISGMV